MYVALRGDAPDLLIPDHVIDADVQSLPDENLEQLVSESLLIGIKSVQMNIYSSPLRCEDCSLVPATFRSL